MKSHFKFILYASFISTFWTFLWITDLRSKNFFLEHVVVIFFQVLVIKQITKYVAPQLLLKKKYINFLLILMTIILLATLFSNWINEQLLPKDLMPPQQRRQDGHKPPPPYLLHFFYYLISALLVISVESFWFGQQKEKETIIKKNELLQNELKLLKFQINPHFLFNALNNIYALAGIDASKTRKSISFLSDMLRYVIYDCEKEFVSIKQELTYIENYIQLFKLKNKNIDNINFKHSIEDENFQIAPMLLIPFVENAFKHSGVELLGNNFVDLEINCSGKYLEFNIKNSKTDLLQKKDEAGGIGLVNVKKRLQILYPHKFELNIKEEETSFAVNLKVETND